MIEMTLIDTNKTARRKREEHTRIAQAATRFHQRSNAVPSPLLS